MNITPLRDVASNDWRFDVRVSEIEIAELSDRFGPMLMQYISRAIAERYLETHATEVLSRINPEAVANMAIAEAGAAVNETLKKKLADRVDSVERATVYQRGIFGGLKRL